MARTSRAFSRRRLGAALGGLALLATLAGCSVPFVTATPGRAPSRAGSTGAASGERIVVCESGTVSRGGVDTSSAVVVRLPAGTPVPPGCREG